METYSEFLNRINSFEKSELHLGNEYFNINPSALKKIDINNNFSPFYGDTVVFDFDKNTKNIIFSYIEKLHDTVPCCFCEKLVENTLHMTLHDLSNSPILSEIAAEMFFNEIKLKEKFRSAKKSHQKIKMQSNFIFNMVHTSIVMGFKPASEEDYLKLMNLYETVNSIKNLPYPLTPHVTLAYYNRNGFSRNDAEKLENIVNSLNKESITIELDTQNLVYQKFTEMNSYTSIFNLI